MDKEKNRLELTIVEARNLVAADLNGKSDPYVVLKGGKGIYGNAKTKIINKTLSPVWKETFNLTFDYQLSNLVLKVFDHDALSADDKIGKVKISSDLFLHGAEIDQWFPIHPKGEIHLKIKADLLYPFIVPGSYLPINYRKFTVALGWDISKKTGTVDLDTSVVVFDSNKDLLTTVNFGCLTGLNGGLTHRGDNRTGEGTGDDEEIYIDLDKIEQNDQVKALAIFVNSFTGVPLSKVRSAYVRLKNENGHTLILARLSGLRDKLGLLFGYLYKVNGQWYFKTSAVACDGTGVSSSVPEVVNEITF